MHKKNLNIIFLFLVLLVASCGRKHKKNTAEFNPNDFNEPLINANKMYVERESDEINQYVKRHNLNMTTTGTGLRYMIYKKGNGERAVTGKYAKVKYKISLLDGTECYSSDKTGPKEFLIGQDHVESGLHEGILLVGVGDKAIFILPSHLAHGLLGDENKIPPKASVIYDIELISLR